MPHIPGGILCIAAIVLLVSACTAEGMDGTTGTAVSRSATPSGMQSVVENPTRGGELILQIPGMHLADVTRDLTYAEVDGQQLLMDVYRPASASTGPPVVLLGGPPAFDAGKASGQKIGWGQLIAARGMAAAVFDIRSDNFQATPRDPAEDVAAAIAFLRSEGGDLGLDPDRMCTFGFSIGTAPWHLWATMREPQDFIRCNVVYYGPLDFQAPEFQMDPALADEFSALTYLRRDGPRIAPMFIAKALQDRFEGINQSIDRLTALAGELNAPVTLIEHREGVHGFDLQTPGARTIEIMEATLDFLETSLSPG